jgi:hypothetical protein
VPNLARDAAHRHDGKPRQLEVCAVRAVGGQQPFAEDIDRLEHLFVTHLVG